MAVIAMTRHERLLIAAEVGERTRFRDPDSFLFGLSDRDQACLRGRSPRALTERTGFSIDPAREIGSVIGGMMGDHARRPIRGER